MCRLHRPQFQSLGTALVLGVLMGIASLVVSAKSARAEKAAALGGPPNTGHSPMVECDHCAGHGQMDCPECEGSGKQPLKCSKCKGRNSIRCSIRRCAEGQLPCKPCRGKGSILVKVIGITGGASTQPKTCGRCSGTGSTKCARCEAGRKDCPRCRGGKKLFYGNCKECKTKKKVTCDQCVGVGKVKPPPLGAKLTRTLQKLQQSFASLKSQTEITQVEALRAQFTAGRKGLKSLNRQLTAALDADKLGMTPSLERHRTQLRKNFKSLKSRYSSSEAESSLTELKTDVDALISFRKEINDEFENILTRNDGRQDEEIRNRIVQVRSELQKRTGIRKETERGLKRVSAKISKLDRRAKSLREEFSSFFKRHTATQLKMKKARERAEAENREPSLAVTIRKALRKASKQTKLPKLRLRDEPEEGDATATIEYLDTEATPTNDPHSSYALTEKYLRRIPKVARAVFGAHEHLAVVQLDVVSVVASDEEEGESESHQAVQSFTISRDLLLAPAEATSDDKEQPSEWESLLARSSPNPPFPPVPTGSFWTSIPVQVTFYLALLLGGAFFWASQRRSAKPQAEGQGGGGSVWIAQADEDPMWSTDDSDSSDPSLKPE